MIVYLTDHPHSKMVGGAFAEGCRGELREPEPPTEECAVYGILRGCGQVMKQCYLLGIDCWHIDHGYFRRGHYDGYYRVSRNALQYMGLVGARSDDRWRSLGVEIRPWRRTGKYVVVCPPTPKMAEFFGVTPESWLITVLHQLSQHTDRQAVIKPKNSKPLEEVLETAWCVVTMQSNAAVDAVIQGVPAIVTGESAAGPVAWKMTNIEAPVWPDREPWAANLAYQQFTLPEMRDGTAWRLLHS